MKLINQTWLTSKLYKNFKTSCEVVLQMWRWCYKMFCKKQSAMIMINNKQTNLLSKNDSGPSSEKSTLASLLFSKIVRTPAGVHSDTPAPVYLCPVLPLESVLSTSDCFLLQHQITSDFYITVSYKRNQWSLKIQRLNNLKSNFRQSRYPFLTV